MKKVKYLLLVILMLLTINVKAANSCESSELQRLKELAKKVVFDYDYKVNGDDVEFTINATNLNKELKVLIIENYYAGKYREFKGDETGTLGGFKSGERVVITIKGYVPNDCSGVTVLTKTVKLPYYNWFYSENRCRGHEDFKYCKRLIDNDISEEVFEREYDKHLDSIVEKYEKEKAEEQKAEESKEEENKDIFIIIGVGLLIAAIISMLIAIIVKKRKKNKL